MTFINIPVEWFSIGFNWTWMLLFGDIRQGIFYSMLLSFWIIFCGEHLMVPFSRSPFPPPPPRCWKRQKRAAESARSSGADACPVVRLQDQTERNRLWVYWKQVVPIVFGSFCLFIFDMCER